MGPGIPLTAIAFGVVVFASAALLLNAALKSLGVIKTWMFARILVSVSIGVGALGAGSISAIYLLTPLTSGEKAYQIVFGRWPDSSIKVIRKEVSAGTDFEFIFLNFRASPNTRAEEDIADMHLQMTEFTAAWFDRYEHPEWWSLEACEAGDVMIASDTPRWNDIVVIKCAGGAEYFVMAAWIN